MKISMIYKHVNGNIVLWTEQNISHWLRRDGGKYSYHYGRDGNWTKDETQYKEASEDEKQHLLLSKRLKRTININEIGILLRKDKLKRILNERI